MVPSPAVITVVMILLPTFKSIASDADPLDTVVLLTFIVAVPSVLVGVSLMDVVALLTEAV